MLFLDCRAVTGGVLQMLGEASTSGTSSSSFGQGIAYIANCTFSDNHADVPVENPSQKSTAVTGASPSFDTLQASGGVIHFLGAMLWIQHSAFRVNTAGKLGGAIMYQRSCTQVGESD